MLKTFLGSPEESELVVMGAVVTVGILGVIVSFCIFFVLIILSGKGKDLSEITYFFIQPDNFFFLTTGLFVKLFKPFF